MKGLPLAAFWSSVCREQPVDKDNFKGYALQQVQVVKAARITGKCFVGFGFDFVMLQCPQPIYNFTDGILTFTHYIMMAFLLYSNGSLTLKKMLVFLWK